jgi:hypothetical protein
MPLQRLGIEVVPVVVGPAAAWPRWKLHRGLVPGLPRS